MMKNFCCLLLLFPISFVCMAQEVEIRVHEVQRGESLEHVAEQDSLSMNPRGVYKLMSIIGCEGQTFQEPFERYKICTDSLTLTLNIEDNQYTIGKLDEEIYNYTGEELDEYNPHTTRIYDSNNQQFIRKWWNDEYPDSIYYPMRGWYVERYEAGRFSEKGKAIVDAFMQTDYEDDSNPLFGIWRLVNSVKDTQAPDDIKCLREGAATTYYSDTIYCVLMPNLFLNLSCKSGKGEVFPIKINDRNSLQITEQQCPVTWFAPDSIAFSWRQEYTMWVRANREASLFSAVATVKPAAQGRMKVHRFRDEKKIMAVDSINFSSLDINLSGRIDMDEVSAAHKRGYIWVRLNQSEMSYSEAKKGYIEMLKRGQPKELAKYMDELIEEIIHDHTKDLKKERGMKQKVTQYAHDLMIEHYANNKLGKNLMLSKKRAIEKTEKEFNERYEIMSEEEHSNRRQLYFDILKRINDIMPDEAKKSEDELRELVPKDMSELPDFMWYIITGPKTTRKKSVDSFMDYLFNK